MDINVTFTYCSKGGLGISKSKTTWKNQFGVGRSFSVSLYYVEAAIETFRGTAAPEAPSE